MSFDELIPAGALDQHHSNVIPIARHEDHERVLDCQGCGQTILVCGYVDDLDPDGYVGVFCGCRQPVDPRPLEVASAVAMERAEAAATGRGIPF